MQSHSLLLSRAEIGDFLGLAIETVSRQLNKLQAMDIVELEHNRAIRIVDVDRLKQEAGSAEPDSGVSGRDRPDPDRDEGRAQPSSRQRFAP
jgi:hypothetical protein